MRLGELINLEWTDIDFERRAITIKVKDFWEPKNSKPRAIPMTDRLIEVLKELKKDIRWVFTARNGRKCFYPYPKQSNSLDNIEKPARKKEEKIY